MADRRHYGGQLDGDRGLEREPLHGRCIGSSVTVHKVSRLATGVISRLVAVTTLLDRFEAIDSGLLDNDPSCCRRHQ
jgi:hypothetical protein